MLIKRIVNQMGFLPLLLLLSLSIEAQIQKGLVLLGKVPGEQFGRNIKLSADGTVLAVAAPFNSEYGDKLGRIEVYKFDGNNWSRMGKEILAGPGDFNYGEHMELSKDGRILVVGAPFQSVNIYTFSNDSWVKSVKSIQLEKENDMLQAITMSSDMQHIAVAFESSAYKRCCIRIFKQKEEQWIQEGNDIIPAPLQKIYGLSLSLSKEGNLLAIGNYSKDTMRMRNAGEVLFYKKEGDQWIQQKGRIMGEAQDTNLGNGVVLSDLGTRIVVSSNSLDLFHRNTGFVETYEFSGSAWKRKSPAIRPAKPNSYFGHAIALSGDGSLLALSTPYLGFGKPGYVKVYRVADSGWVELASIIDRDGVETTSSPNNSTGWSIAISSTGNTLAIGFPHNDENGDMSGKVVVYDF
ncbi:hypothetical protein [Flavihumibacter sp. UBA7668]|uniref:hypothetical protein n=1 Tax=Flavihumibacter sp. UBA7668 TaxID=1946542 RepID=UPI0025C543E3|nr:hypothetical protein [Flavihumibacter sp. UBA7668]